jgi:hypothetical protein
MNDTDPLIKNAIERYSNENHGLTVPAQIRDMITWLIVDKANKSGLEEAERYASGSGLWDDLIKNRERDNELTR